MLGIKPENIYIEDVREEFVRDFVFPMFRANALYEGLYLLGTSIARPLISKRLVEIAAETGADAVAHGATGKGNDQVRFELSAYALNPEIKVIAPWRRVGSDQPHQADRIRREATRSRSPRTSAARRRSVWMPTCCTRLPRARCWRTRPKRPPITSISALFRLRTRRIHRSIIEDRFERGDAVAINGEPMSPATILTKLNELGGKHGIGRLDLVENRFVGMKSRGIYETPGGTVLLEAHRGIEQITLDAGAGHLKDSIMPRYAELIYNGFWFSPEREMLQALIDKSQEHVTGTVRLKLYKGMATSVGRWSDHIALFRSACDLRG